MTEIEHVPTVQHRSAFDYAGIEVSASLQDWGEVNACMPELFGWLGERGIEPAGSPFNRIVRGGTEVDPFQVVVGVPVSARFSGDGRVRPFTMPAGTYATYVLTAWFDELWTVHDSVNRWLEVEGRVLQTDDNGFVAMYEQYLTDPDTEPDRDKQRTLVAYKLDDGAGEA